MIGVSKNRSGYDFPNPVRHPHAFWWALGCLTRTKWVRHYVLSRDIGARRKFICRLREWANHWIGNDVEREVVQTMIREERRDLNALIAQREALWQKG